MAIERKKKEKMVWILDHVTVKRNFPFTHFFHSLILNISYEPNVALLR